MGDEGPTVGSTRATTYSLDLCIYALQRYLRNCIYCEKVVDISGPTHFLFFICCLIFLLYMDHAVSHSTNRKLSIPQLAGSVWEACDALKKTPTTNYTAIGRAITQVAVSVKDVLREMKELKPSSTPSTTAPEDRISDEGPDMASAQHDEEGSSEGDLGNDLSPDEMLIAQSVIVVVSDILLVIKEIIRFVTGLLRQSNDPNKSGDCVDSLEKLLEICRGIGIQVDELGACVYPPQEVSLMKVAAKKISGGVNGLHVEIQNIGPPPSEGFFHACQGLESSLRKLESELGCSDMDLIPEMEGLAIQDHAVNT